MDLISQLPEPILHTILSFLPPKDAVRTSILSKTWGGIEGRNPFLGFNEFDFRYAHHEPNAKIMRKNLFLSYVDNRLERVIHNKLAPLIKFRLSMFSYEPEHDSVRIDLWLKHVMEKGIKELNLNVWAYNLPPFVVASEALTVLSLYNCKLDACGRISLPQLRELVLDGLEVDEDFIEHLICGCPLLEFFTLSSCSMLTTLQVTSIHKLKRVVVSRCPDLRNVQIQSPNLQCFGYGGLKDENRDEMPCELALAPSGTMQQLILMSAKIKRAWLRQQISRCEELSLIDIDGFEHTKISSQMLKKLIIQRCKNMKKVAQINCPNLQSLTYLGNGLPFFSVNHLNLQDIRIEFCLEDNQHAVWSEKLKEFFRKFSSDKEFIKQVFIYAGQEDVFILDGLMDFMVPELHDVKDSMPKQRVLISSVSNSLGLDSLVNDIFSKCQNISYKTLNVVSTHSSNGNFSHVLYDKLWRIKAEANCCRDKIYKCWRHYLCNVKKDSTSNTALAALRSHQFDQYQVTRIMLEWAN